MMSVKFRYLGWTAFELTMDTGLKLIFDPMLSGRPSEGVPPSPVSLDEFDDVDIVLISHAAADHVGQAFDILERNPKAKLVCDTTTRFKALAAGISGDRIHFMVSGVRYLLSGVSFKALPAAHHSFSQLGEQFISAQPLSYIVTAPSGEKIFFGGDTSITSDHKMFGELYKPDVALLGVGGVDILGQSCTELYPDEAALVAKWLGVKHAFPMHYRFNEGAEFAEELSRVAPEIESVVLKPGDSYELNAHVHEAA